MHRLLVAVVLLAACGSKKQAQQEVVHDAAPAAKCKPVPGCIPAEPTGALKCEIGGVAFTCPRCGDNGGLLECKDTDGDGCVEPLRTECGRPSGCETVTEGLDGARCKKLDPDVAINQFGVVGPAGFVPCETGATLPVVDDTLTIRIRTRAMFVNPTSWSIALKGAGLDLSMPLAEGKYLDVADDFGILQFDLGVQGFDEKAKDVVLTYELQDYANHLTQTCGPVTLARATR